MLPNIQKEGLADYIDIFCEKGFFDATDTIQMIEWGEAHGLKAKIHTNQFNSIGGIEAAVQKSILSVDHLEVLNEREMDLLANSQVLPVLLPGAAFFLRIAMPPARRLIEKDLPLVLASDFNPGSSPGYSMANVLALACVEMRMLPNEAFNAATLNAAFALELQEEIGSISKGKRANICILKEGRDTNHIPYYFGSDSIDQVIINGEAWV
jgi:imidazolonepropionase